MKADRYQCKERLVYCEFFYDYKRENVNVNMWKARNGVYFVLYYYVLVLSYLSKYFTKILYLFVKDHVV